MVMAERCMRDGQRLERHRAFFHIVADARAGIDHDLVGQLHMAGAVHFLFVDESFAVGPVLIHQRHADGTIGIEHLLG